VNIVSGRKSIPYLKLYFMDDSTINIYQSSAQVADLKALVDMLRILAKPTRIRTGKERNPNWHFSVVERLGRKRRQS
jgi:hypothetical protein